MMKFLLVGFPVKLYSLCSLLLHKACWGTDFSQNNLGGSVGRKKNENKKKMKFYINSDLCHAMCQNTKISTARIFRK